MELWRGLAAHNGGVESQMEPWRVCRPVVADFHHLKRSRIRTRIRINVNNRILIRIKAERDPDPHLYQLIAEMKRDKGVNKNLYIYIVSL